MNVITCNDCGYVVGEDDFMMGCCPICDSSMQLNEINIQARPELEEVVRCDVAEEWPLGTKNSDGRFG